MIYIYLLGFFLKNFMSKNKDNKFFYYFLVWLISKNYFDDINYDLKNFFTFENSFWNYINILNNNNKSVIFFISIFYFNIKENKKLNYTLLILTILTIIFEWDKNYLKFTIDINFTLINGFLLIHPVFMYFGYVSLLFLIFLINNINKNSIKKKNEILTKSFNFVNISFFYISISLFLGSYWSQQELNWGGWWNWDFVEIIALMFVLLNLFLLHININKKTNFIKNYSIKIFNYFLLFFFLIRLDILNSIHSFNSLEDLNYNLNTILNIYIIFIIIVFFAQKNNYDKYLYNNINIVPTIFILLLFIFNLYIYISIILSFYFDLRYTELTKYLKNELNLIYFLIFMYLLNKNIFLYIILLKLYIIDQNLLYIIFSLYIIIIINNYKNNYKNINHIFIIIFIIINYYYYILQENLINLYSLKTNINLLNNKYLINYHFNDNLLNIYYNKNNYLFTINNYFYYNNNNILFSSVLKETLLNNILLLYKQILIFYNIDDIKIFINFNNSIIYIFLFYITIYIFLYKKKQLDNIV